ncbi:nucleoside diphosphate-linked moiety X motif 13-like [Asterias rubens]|uniref:nucleoside diphosphate-linked moiety X motif 13-like n=1 Tax=Asterias rubens TaxID=7604 RepID=UPI0014551866|nr:nucleoside diphosphate-linked moiety X motif 13-like [Asterias rubens]
MTVLQRTLLCLRWVGKHVPLPTTFAPSSAATAATGRFRISTSVIAATSKIDFSSHHGFLPSCSYTSIVRRHSSSSTFVQGMRHLQKLKEDQDEDFCRESWASGRFLVLYDMKPVLKQLEDGKQWGIAWSNVNDLCDILQEAHQSTVEESIVLNCISSDTSGPAKFAFNIPAKTDPEHKREIEEALGGFAVSERKAFFVVSREDARVLSQCFALLQWHSKNGFCSNCGSKTNKDPPGAKRVCPNCEVIHYPAVSPVAIVLVTNGDRCLVVRQKKFPPAMYSAIAGFCEPGEALEATVRREIAEEVGLEVEDVTFFSSQPWAFPSSTLMLGCHAHVKQGTADEVNLDEAELEGSRWLHRDEVKAILKENTPGRGDGVWFPPSRAIAHHLLKSWASQQ